MDLHSCSRCHLPVLEDFYFCPHCGKKFRDPPVSTTVLKQIEIYVISILLPPLGLWPGIKYLKQENQKAKMIGSVAIILTIISIVITSWIALDMFNKFNATLNAQMQQYQNLTY